MAYHFLNGFKNKRIAVLGDVILDQYIFGEVERISPEAPIPVVRVVKEELRLGGAANVANNIKALGAEPCLLGVIGNDEYGTAIIEKANKAGINIDLLRAEDRPTTVKTRVIGCNQQIVRFDKEKRENIPRELETRINDLFENLIMEAEGVIISDYNKGTITDYVARSAIFLANKSGKKVLVDPKPENVRNFSDCYLLTPNMKEAERIAGAGHGKANSMLEMGRSISKRFNCNIAITCGEEGIFVYDKSGKHKHIFNTSRKIYDVTGAGDTVIAVLSLCLASNADVYKAAEVAVHAAGKAVEKVGTSTVGLKELKSLLQ